MLKKSFFGIALSLGLLVHSVDITIIVDDPAGGPSGSGVSLYDAITTANSDTTPTNNYIIEFNPALSSTVISLTQPLPFINAKDDGAGIDRTLTIDGSNVPGLTIGDTNGELIRGLFANAGTLNFNDITIDQLEAVGGNGTSTQAGGGGGGLGAGGALFIREGTIVNGNNINFSNNTARGGNGGGADAADPYPAYGGGGGGGIGGNGNTSSLNITQGGGGGGGVFPEGIGGTPGEAGAGGGSGGGGGGGFGPGSNGFTTSGGAGADSSQTGGKGGNQGTPGNDAIGSIGGGGGGGGGLPTGARDGGSGGNGAYGGGGGGGGGNDLQGTGDPRPGKGGSGGGPNLDPDNFGGGGGGGAYSMQSSGTVEGGSAGNGGFGGGGGGGGPKGAAVPALGRGGFGAGDGGIGNSGGSSGAKGGGGGGGAGLGGAIFMDRNTTLYLTDPTFTANSVTEGTAGSTSGAVTAATDGSAYGIDLFMVSSAVLDITTNVPLLLTHPIEGNQGKNIDSLTPGRGDITVGGLKKRGPAMLQLTGYNTYSGTTEVIEGELRLEPINVSPLSSTVVVSNVEVFAKLSGQGAVAAFYSIAGGIAGGDLNIKSGGTISPGPDATDARGTIAIPGLNSTTGIFTQEGGSFYEVDITPVPTETDFIEASIAVIEPTATVVVRPAPGNYIAGTQYVILSGKNSKTGAYNPTVEIDPAYFPPGAGLEFVFNDTTTQVILRIVNDVEVLPTFSITNAVQVCDNLRDIPLTPGTDLAIFFGLLGALPKDKMERYCNALGPGSSFGRFELLALDQMAAVGSMIGQHLLCKEDMCFAAGICGGGNDSKFWNFGGMAFGDRNHGRKKESSYWAQPFGFITHSDDQGSLLPFRSFTKGVITGVDFCLNPSAQLGFGLGYSHTNYKFHPEFGRGVAHSFFNTLYFAYCNSWIFFDASVAGGFNYYDGRREIQFTVIGINFHNTSFYDKFSANAGAHIGLMSRKGLSHIYPFANVDISYMYQHRLSETDGATMNQDIRAENSSALRTEAGLQWAKASLGKRVCTRPYAFVSWVMKNSIGDGNYTANFINQSVPFTTEGFRGVHHMGSAGLGVAVKRINGMQWTAGYRGELGKNTRAHEGSFSVLIPF